MVREIHYAKIFMSAKMVSVVCRLRRNEWNQQNFHENVAVLAKLEQVWAKLLVDARVCNM